jgi:hypothetical protein
MDVKKDGPVSRQREYQRRMVASGRCRLCGEPRNLYANFCDAHAEKSREQQRKYYRARRGIPLDMPLRNSGRRRSDGTKGD